MPRACGAAALLLALLAQGAALAQPAEPVDRPPDAALREQILRIPLAGTAAQALAADAELRVTLFLPPGEGPFPLALIHHGRGEREKRETMQRPRFESAARYFLRKGIAVAVPQRLGYGAAQQGRDPEALHCGRGNYGEIYAALVAQSAAVLEGLSAQGQPIDRQRVLQVGVSVGGVGALAAASLSGQGVLAALNFSGGHGGDPDKRPGEPCASEAMRKLMLALGRAAAKTSVPTLWLYAENDRYFGSWHAKRWHGAYVAGGGHAELQMLAPLGDDGHQLMSHGNDRWQTLADAFLAPLGFAGRPGALGVPPTAAVAVDDVAALPWTSAQLAEAYRRFLAKPGPRAFYVDPRLRRWGYAHGDDALSRALAFCARASAADCRPYAVDEAVVWAPG